MHNSPDAILTAEFIFDTAPFPSCHAATLCETDDGLLAAYFGGSHERHPDVEVYISRRKDGRWGEPVSVANGILKNGGPRQPTWNPVLFQPKHGPLYLFYKVGPSPKLWWGEYKTSDDNGHTWSDAIRLPDGIYGPIKNKPVQLPDGTIVSPTSIEKVDDANDDGLGGGHKVAPVQMSDDIPVPPRRPGPPGWFTYFELSTDSGRSWTATPELHPTEQIDSIQGSILIHTATKLQAVGRTRSKKMFQTWSNDGGKTWGELTLLNLPNCNSGTDAVSLADGRHLIVYNHSDTPKVRYPLNVAVSADGTSWEAAVVLDTEPPGQYSYPAMIQGRDGTIHIAYTWKRLKMKYVALDPTKLKSKPFLNDAWPA